MTPNLAEALAVLGVEPGTSLVEVRTRYRELLRSNHPDGAASSMMPGEANERTISVNRAFAIVVEAIDSGDGVCVPHPSEAPVQPGPRAHEPGRNSARVGLDVEHDGDTIHLDVPAPEAFALLLDAGAAVGGIGYVDRSLGLLELIVRFEGGPSCSVLVTLQGRAFGTDAFITMESIEAAPTPSLVPVLDALIAELRLLT